MAEQRATFALRQTAPLPDDITIAETKLGATMRTKHGVTDACAALDQAGRFPARHLRAPADGVAVGNVDHAPSLP